MLLPTDQPSQEKFAKSAVTIALNNFHWNFATLVLFNSTLVYSVDIFIGSYQKNVIVGHGTFYPGIVKRVRQYVIFGADLTDIEHMLSWMQRHQFDNTGTYIVVCQSESSGKCNDVDLVNTLWIYKIINVVLINNRMADVNGFTYYEPEDCMNIRPTNVKNWDSCLLNGHRNCQNMYPLKLKNLHRCPITVSTFNQVPYMNISTGTPTGADGDLLCVIAKAMNLSLVMMTPRIGYGWGKLEDNGTWTGSLADVYHDWANFSMTSPSITLSRFSNFHLSTDYAVGTVAWVTHPSEIQPSSLKLFRPFQPYVWIVLGISLVIVVIIMLLLTRKCLSSSERERNVTYTNDIVLHSWELFMGLPINSFPTNKALLYLTVFWIWYCFLIRTLYQVYLINSLQTDVYTPEFDTIEESIASKYVFGGGLALRDFFIDNALVYNGWKNVESFEINPLMMKLSKGLKFVLAMNMETTKMFLSLNPDIKLHILPQVIIRSPTVIFFKKYSPLADSLNIVLLRLRESGIAQKLYIDNTGKKVLKEELDNKIPISMTHYTGCYLILLTGWLMSGLCFVLERLIIRWNRRN